jgi:ribosomal protein L11 methyltransferase
MDYCEICIEKNNLPESLPEILVAVLSNLGFESFTEDQSFLYAYVKESEFSLKETDKILSPYFVAYSQKIIKAENWNAQWESSYNPVIIDDTLVICAPFHKNIEKKKYCIVIAPKMSFGTGHHETTALMCSLILKRKWTQMKVLDMGAGTGVLGLLCSKLKAANVTAIDNDPIILDNINENIKINKAPNVKAFVGDRNSLSEIYDAIVANINRNVLLQDISYYSKHLVNNGTLLLSGFFNADLEAIANEAIKNGLQFVTSQTKNNWTAAEFIKNMSQ